MTAEMKVCDARAHDADVRPREKDDTKDRAEHISREHNGPGCRPEGSQPGSVKEKQAGDTRTLENKGTLPRLHLEQTQPQLQSQSSKPQKDWTIAVQLAGSLPGDNNHPSGFGTERQLAELKRMAKETEGKSVNFVVHAERPVDSKGALCEAGKDPAKRGACVESATEANRQKTERYFIHDGKIDKLPDVKYSSAQENLSGLLKDAGKVSPSEKIGLFIQSHGVGSDGIDTNQGPISLNKTVGAIEKGLKGSGHDKLDILDFNACDMGAAKVLDKTAKIAKDVVASAAAELGTDTHDAQNMSAAFRALMQNPKMSGKELGETIVRQSASGDTGVGQQNAIKTLANFDMEKYGDFKKDLDRFGASLSDVASDPANLRALKQVIDQTTVPQTGGPAFDSHNRDLKQFAGNVLEAIKSGKLSGDTSALEKGAQSLLKSFDNMASAQFGEKSSNYDKLGGLAINLPGKEITNSRETARLLSPFHQLSDMAGEMLENGVKLADKSKISKSLEEQMKELKEGLGPFGHRALQQIDGAHRAIDKAKSLEELTAAIKQLQSASEKTDGSRYGRMLKPFLLDEAAHMQEAYRRKSGRENITPGWDSFLDKLYRHMT